VPLLGKPLIAHTLREFEECPAISEIVLVVDKQDVSRARRLIRDFRFCKVRTITAGGPHRQDSVRNGLQSVAQEAEIIVIHDGARPLVGRRLIEASIKTANEAGAAIAAVRVIDTIKTSHDGRFVESTPDRDSLWSVQTPQTFKREVIETAYERAYADGFYGTDDASLVERIGLPVALIEGSYENIKVTTPTDMIVAETLLSRRLQDSNACSSGSMVKVGYGYDVHGFAPERRLFLGGVEFAGEQGLKGHSDADVVLHAAMDALLGATGLGDIGRLFPNTDPAYKDIRSTELLKKVGRLLIEKGWKVGNLDIMVLAERPQIAPRAPEMCAVIADCLGASTEQISIKASTSEGLGFIGRGEGIACHAVALVSRTG